MKQNLKSIEKSILNLSEFTKMKGVWQNKFHEFDVYRHTLEYVRHLKKMTKDANLIVAGYFHDIGKPTSAKPKYINGKLQKNKSGKTYHEFDNHEEIGEKMIQKMNSNFFILNELDQKRIAKLVGAHYLPMKGIKSMREAKDFREFKKRYFELIISLKKTKLSLEDIWIMFLADKLSQGKFCTDKKELFAIRDSILTGKPSTQELYALQKKIYANSN